jgi:hypothetical protein
LSCLVLCANDPVAAWGGVKLLDEEFGLAPDLVTGPATDNRVGKDLIQERLGIQAINALTDGVAFGDAVQTVLGLKTA